MKQSLISTLPPNVQLLMMSGLTDKNKQLIRMISKNNKEMINSLYRKHLRSPEELKMSLKSLDSKNKKLIKELGNNYSSLFMLSNSLKQSRLRGNPGWPREIHPIIKSLSKNSRLHARNANITANKVSEIYRKKIN
tara:strand:+ start:408 stop:815 length:408 start_codon:yes stop_codon:yes gene_type:complete